MRTNNFPRKVISWSEQTWILDNCQFDTRASTFCRPETGPPTTPILVAPSAAIIEHREPSNQAQDILLTHQLTALQYKHLKREVWALFYLFQHGPWFLCVLKTFSWSWRESSSTYEFPKTHPSVAISSLISNLWEKRGCKRTFWTTGNQKQAPTATTPKRSLLNFL